jgi:osmotically-inducible protein OsmY
MISVKERDPQRVKNNIMDQLIWDSRIDSSNIAVNVTDGTVTLSGTVPSYADRRNAETDAYFTPGVYKVVDQLEVKHPAGTKIPSDADIKENIDSAYFWNSSIDSSKINVMVNGGVVTLKGSVDAYWKKLRTEEIASEATGVIDVINELAIVPGGTYTDESIANSIESALARNTTLDVNQINVKVDDGAVTLSGTVPDWYGYRAAQDIANYTYGVTSVKNNLTIQY